MKIKQKRNIDNHYTSFNVKLAFFTVYVLTLQTGVLPIASFFGFLQMTLPLNKFTHTWFVLCINKPGPLLGVQAERSPLGNFFVSPGKTCWTKFSTIGHSSNIFVPSQKNLRSPWCPKLFTSLNEACVKKKHCCQKSPFLEPMLPLHRGGFTLFTMVLYNSENNTSTPIPN